MNRFLTPLRSSQGQILPLALAFVGAMALGWLMLLNVGKLIKERVQLQIAADTAVLSSAAMRARGLNTIGLINSWIGTPVAGLGLPDLAWWPALPHQMDEKVLESEGSVLMDALKSAKKMLKAGQFNWMDVGGVLAGIGTVLGKFIGITYDIHSDYALKQKKFVHTLLDIQNDYAKTYGGSQAWLKADAVARAQGADGIYAPKGSFALGLKRNRGLIQYWRTMHVWVYGRGPGVLPMLPNDETTEDNAYRWREADARFYQKAQRLYAYRLADSPQNGPFPLGKRIFGIDMPDLYAVSAARIYNTGGRMFPTAEEATGFQAGYPAQRRHKKASIRWRAQLVPVEGLYGH